MKKEVPSSISKNSKSREHKKGYGKDIAQRPEIAVLRIEVGHWEGDIVVGKKAGNEAVVLSLLEKKTENYIASIFPARTLGIVIATKASIAGAEGGCQAETGSASGMAAAALVELEGGTPQQCIDALGMSLINLMGLVCDPVAGLVEIPCIKRNASGAAVALTSATMALAGVPLHIPSDECLSAMKRVGDSMSASLRETALGGLAVTPTGRKLKEQVYGKTKDEEEDA